jgi:hypothetical protein
MDGSYRGNYSSFEGRSANAEVSVSGSESDVDLNQDCNSDIRMHPPDALQCPQTIAPEMLSVWDFLFPIVRKRGQFN